MCYTLCYKDLFSSLLKLIDSLFLRKKKTNVFPTFISLYLMMFNSIVLITSHGLLQEIFTNNAKFGWNFSSVKLNIAKSHELKGIKNLLFSQVKWVWAEPVQGCFAGFLVMPRTQAMLPFCSVIRQSLLLLRSLRLKMDAGIPITNSNHSYIE